MKVLFINPPNTNELVSNIPAVFKNDRGRIPALGILSLAACIREKHEPMILDGMIEGLDYEGLANKALAMKPDVIGFTVTTFSLKDVNGVLHYIRKKVGKSIPIIMGGPHVIIYPQETIDALGADYAVSGEGENLILPLIDHIAAGKNGTKKIWKQETYITDLDDIPFPARDLTQIDKYYNVMSAANPVTTSFSSRGCPYLCTFCDRPTYGKGFRYMSAKRVADEMEICQDLGIKEIMYYDDTFTVSKQRVYELCQEVHDRKITIKWDVRSRVDTVDKKLMQEMYDANCVRIHFGVESGSPKILRELNKGIQPDQVIKAFKEAHDIGFTTLGCFMLGNPTETKDDIKKTLRLAKKIKPDYVVCSVLSPYPATRIYLKAMDIGLLKDVWKKYATELNQDFKAPLWLENFTKEGLVDELKTFYRKFYLTPGYIWRRLRGVGSLTQLWNFAKAGMSMIKLTHPSYDMKR